jgi:hypothetical protein
MMMFLEVFNGLKLRRESTVVIALTIRLMANAIHETKGKVLPRAVVPNPAIGCRWQSLQLGHIAIEIDGISIFWQPPILGIILPIKKVLVSRFIGLLAFIR